jgi:hypothetical protein
MDSKVKKGAKTKPAKVANAKVVKPTKVTKPAKATKAAPGEADPMQRFYTSLFIQTQGKSEMARAWCEKHGLLHEVMAIAEASQVSEIQSRIADMHIDDGTKKRSGGKDKKA